MINWKVRLKNKSFWITIVPSILILIQLVGKLFGFEIDLSDRGDAVVDIINCIFAILATLGIVTDPTTDGVGDSARALTYDTPANDEAVMGDADGVGAAGKFSKRTTAPAKSNKWFYKSNPFYLCGYGLPNCTAYAWGRFAEILGAAPTLSTSNAENWYGKKDGYKRGKTPKLGAVIVWAKGKVGNGSDGAGHVAIVEEIYSDGSFLVSESGWHCSPIMWTMKIPKSCKRAGYSFLGFIYNPAVTDETVVKTDSKFVVGNTYKTVVALKVRTGAGTGYRWKNRSELSADAKKHAQNGTYAVLNEGTEVTCQAVKGNWIKIASGWICTKSGSDIYVK